GLALLEDELARLAADGRITVPGEVAFRLYDTYGFPLDIVTDVSGKRGFAVAEAGFADHMQEQKKRARAAWKGSGEKDLASRFQALLDEGIRSEFFGYERLCGQSRVVALLDADALPVDRLAAGETGFAVMGRTP